MAVFKGWMDDSQRGSIWAVGGYVGAEHRWEYFEKHWPLALAKHGVCHFHMREMADPNGCFSKWHPPQDHRQELAEYFGDLAKVITDSCLVGVLSLVRMQDLKRFNTEKGLCLEAYSLAAYGCMLVAVRDNPGWSIELVFDHTDKVASKLAIARDYADSDNYEGPEAFGKITALPLPKSLTAKEIPAIQAADFFAWEFRKNHENVSEWFDLVDRPDDPDEAWEHMQQWSLRKFGSSVPPRRKSANALLDGNEFYPLVWDYKTICEAHELRGGVWQ